VCISDDGYSYSKVDKSSEHDFSSVVGMSIKISRLVHIIIGKIYVQDVWGRTKLSGREESARKYGYGRAIQGASQFLIFLFI
jgi:hypothetical protein